MDEENTPSEDCGSLLQAMVELLEEIKTQQATLITEIQKITNEIVGAENG